MKHLILLLSTVLLVGCGRSQNATSNLPVNNSAHSEWQEFNADPKRIKLEVKDGIAHIVNNIGIAKEPNIFANVSKIFFVKKGMKYWLTFKVKSKDNVGAALVVVTDKAWNKRTYITSGTYDYTNHTHAFIAESDTVPIVFFSEQGGEVWLDLNSVKIEELSESW